MEPNILIVNPFGIGDVMFSTPLIEILKENYPNSYIAYICNRRAYDILIANPHLDKVFVYEKDEYRAAWKSSKKEFAKKLLDFLKSLKREKFDLVIDLSLGHQYSLVLKLIGVRNRIGFNYRGRGRFLTKKIELTGFDKKHVVEYYLDILKLLNIDTAKYNVRPKLYLTDRDIVWADKFLENHKISASDLLIGVIPGCGASWGVDAKRRRWSMEGFASLCDGAIEKYGAKVILFGDPKEVDICKGVQARMRNKVINAAGRTNLRDLIGLLSKCKLAVSNDGGPLHLAVGIGLRTVSFYGPVDENIYGPYPLGPKHIVIAKHDLTCRPCYNRFKYKKCDNRLCLDLITSEEALNAIGKILNR